MGKKRQTISLGFTEETFPAGSHMCLIYSSETERRELIFKFLEAGLAAGEKVVYFADTVSPDEFPRIFRDGEKPRGFEVFPAEKAYYPDGKFSPGDMLATLRAAYRQAKNDKYPGIRASGEMTWALRGIPGSDRLMEYEALLNDLLVDFPITAVCQYDTNRFDGKSIFDVLQVHPMVIVHGQIVRNPFYLRPKDFLRRYVARK
jgi:hypothetical protein